MKKLKYKDLYVGLEVIDTDFNMEGVVTKCEDPHNVIVEHNDAVNVYCFVENCEEGMYDNNLIKK